MVVCTMVVCPHPSLHAGSPHGGAAPYLPPGDGNAAGASEGEGEGANPTLTLTSPLTLTLTSTLTLTRRGRGRAAAVRRACGLGEPGAAGLAWGAPLALSPYPYTYR